MIGLLSIISGFFSTNFTISLTGSPQIGQGALWYFGLGITLITFTRHHFTVNEKVLIFFFTFDYCFCKLFYYQSFLERFSCKFFLFYGLPMFFWSSYFHYINYFDKKSFYSDRSFLSLGIYFQFIDNNAAKLVWASTLVGAIAYCTLHKLEKIKLFGNLKKILFSSFFLQFIL